MKFYSLLSFTSELVYSLSKHRIISIQQKIRSNKPHNCTVANDSSTSQRQVSGSLAMLPINLFSEFFYHAQLFFILFYFIFLLFFLSSSFTVSRAWSNVCVKERGNECKKKSAISSDLKSESQPHFKIWWFFLPLLM